MTIDALEYGPDLSRLRDQNERFQAGGPAGDPLCQPGVLDAPRAAGAHGVSPRTELALDLTALRFDPDTPQG